MPTRASRSAFTLTELLVVIALIAVLFGLLLPAVAKVRAAAARVRCASNVKQLGLALHSYHDTHARFPAGISGEDNNEPQPFLSWNARLLPYLEQEALWREILVAFAKDRNFLHIPPHVHRNTVIPSFSCPADSRTQTSSTKLRVPMAFTSYLGVSGRNSDDLDGVLFIDSRTRLADITDGSSHTLMVGERPPSSDEKFGWWYAGWGQDKDGSAEVVLGVADRNTRELKCFPGPYRFGLGRVENQCDMFHFWSLHSGGGHFLFADGSVHFIAYSGYPMMPDWATRAGGEVVPQPD